MGDYRTHPEYLALLEAVRMAPADDAPRLIIADFLEEHDQDDRARRIRQGVRSPTSWSGCDGLHLTGKRGTGIEGRYRRGFVYRLYATLRSFMEFAEELFREHPITKVILADKQPEHRHTAGVHEWGWSHFDVGMSLDTPFMLPNAIYGSLEDGDEWTRYWLVYPTERKAMRELSNACVTYGRSLVGLPPLTSTAVQE